MRTSPSCVLTATSANKMEDNRKGTDPEEGCSGDWFIVREAECSDGDENDFEELFGANGSPVSNLSDLIDDSEQAQGNSLQLFQALEQTESEREVGLLKRKLLSTPEAGDIAALSPRLTAVTISPARSQNPPKRRLFEKPQQDSGLELTLNETQNSSEELQQVDGVDGPRELIVEGSGEAPKVQRLLDVLQAKNIRVTLLAKFKTAYEVSFTDLTRPFKSDRTCYTDWVAVLFGLLDEHETVIKTVLVQQCEFMHLKLIGNVCLMLARFKTHKSRDTLRKLLKMTLDIPEHQMLLEPPKTSGAAAAMYWYKTGLSNSAFVHGGYPEWILRQTAITGEVLQHQFSLGDMIQWAYDNELTEESAIAYEYARLAQDDVNASAWLKSNCQAKYVKECAQMVRYYFNAQMMEMSMSQWIDTRCRRLKEDTGNWKPIVQFLRYQGIAFPIFLQAFKPFLKGTPKKHCLVICGPPNSGKTIFTMSLIHFLGGKIISYANAKSHFWLQPLSTAKIALLDDATGPCWNFFDLYLRNLLDGNAVSIDVKHRAPMQIKSPPLLITTNINVLKEERLRYLHSRILQFEFPEPYPFDEANNPIFPFNDQNWKCFFKRLWQQLELSDQEEEGDDGAAENSFRCSAGENPRAL